MKVIVAAVSGGVDSVVLLHRLVQLGHKVVVAHVDHGMRSDSANDALFVRGLAKLYGCPYAEAQLHLGPTASEELARQKRYDFLLQIAQRYDGVIFTAHHGDDLIESIAINLKRGTGWRGLAVLGRAGIKRPLLVYPKTAIYNYALKHELEYVEDETNRDTKYLRNYLRTKLATGLDLATKRQLVDLRNKQINLRHLISGEATTVLGAQAGSRYFFTYIPENVGLELLGALLEDQMGIRPVEAQLARALLAIKTAKPGTVTHVGDKILFSFTPRFFSVEVI